MTSSTDKAPTNRILTQGQDKLCPFCKQGLHEECIAKRASGLCCCKGEPSHQKSVAGLSKKRIENEGKIQNANEILRQVAESGITPKNIRKEIWRALDLLNDTKVGLGVRAANTVSALEGLTRNPNMPSPSRVAVWSAVSILESVRES